MFRLRNLFVLGAVVIAVAMALGYGWNDGRSGTTEAAVTTFVVSMGGAQENPPVNSPGSGFTRFTFDEQTRRLTWDITISGLSPNLVTAAHIHRGAVGVNGPVIYNFSTTGFTQASGEITLTEADVADLKAGNLYVNAHSVDNPGGFARGQIYIDPADGVRATVRGAVDAWNRKDVNRFLMYWTDNALREAFDASSRAEAEEQLPMFIGDPPVTLINVSNIVVSDRTATMILDIANGAAIERTYNVLVSEGGIWRIHDPQPLPFPIPGNVRTVDLKLQEFAFVYDKAGTANGNFAFNIENAGKQDHEVALLKIPSGPALLPFIQELFESEDEGFPPSVEPVAFAGPYEPGTKTTLVFTQALTNGRYALVCGIPDEATGVPHAALGMLSEFTVSGSSAGSGSGGAAGGIRPPSTGDAGLADSTSLAGYAILSIVVLLTLASGATIAGARKRAL